MANQHHWRPQTKPKIQVEKEKGNDSNAGGGGNGGKITKGLRVKGESLDRSFDNIHVPGQIHPTYALI